MILVFFFFTDFAPSKGDNATKMEGFTGSDVEWKYFREEKWGKDTEDD